MMRTNDPVTWRTSSYSANDGNCVEAGALHGASHRAPAVGVRDTKNRGRGRLTVPASTWRMFATAVAHDRVR